MSGKGSRKAISVMPSAAVPNALCNGGA
jgi:hypothetical protein